MVHVRGNRCLPISQGFETKEIKNSNCTNCGIDDAETRRRRLDPVTLSDFAK